MRACGQYLGQLHDLRGLEEETNREERLWGIRGALSLDVSANCCGTLASSTCYQFLPLSRRDAWALETHKNGRRKAAHVHRTASYQWRCC